MVVVVVGGLRKAVHLAGPRGPPASPGLPGDAAGRPRSGRLTGSAPAAARAQPQPMPPPCAVNSAMGGQRCDQDATAFLAPPGWLGGHRAPPPKRWEERQAPGGGKPPDHGPLGPHSRPSSWLQSQAPTPWFSGPPVEPPNRCLPAGAGMHRSSRKTVTGQLQNPTSAKRFAIVVYGCLVRPLTRVSRPRACCWAVVGRSFLVFCGRWRRSRSSAVHFGASFSFLLCPEIDGYQV